MNVLFVCGSNTVRSPVAERILRDKDGFVTKSAGLIGGMSTKGLIDDKTGIDMVPEARFSDSTTHSSQMVDQELIDWADIVLYMQPHMLDGLAAQFGGNTKYVPLDPNNDIPNSNYSGLSRDLANKNNYWTHLRKHIGDSIEVFIQNIK